MESWPLQLDLESPAGREQVMLTENASIRRGGALLDTGALRPGQRVRVVQRTAKGAIAELEIID
jgi:hypothetical protein